MIIALDPDIPGGRERLFLRADPAGPGLRWKIDGVPVIPAGGWRPLPGRHRIALVIKRVRGRYAAFAHDLVMVPVAGLGALWLRFNLGDIPEVYLYHALLDLGAIVPIQAGVFWAFGLYRGVWQFASLSDLVRIAKAVLTGTVAVVLFMTTRLVWAPRSVIPLYAILLAGLLGGPRLLYRWAKDSYLETRGVRGS